ncbi:hypothetical protein HPB47_011754 [Ixodes persulcatus]|uniref:Uncharacterized protein n=1 Tax=Ixodes persulcatus TaxID=34615 RepID=A0AC60NVD3_IXOPE|nr:hypothetical protein HPB47_011754 [Ixodes persulcatus]
MAAKKCITCLVYRGLSTKTLSVSGDFTVKDLRTALQVHPEFGDIEDDVILQDPEKISVCPDVTYLVDHPASSSCARMKFESLTPPSLDISEAVEPRAAAAATGEQGGRADGETNSRSPSNRRPANENFKHPPSMALGHNVDTETGEREGGEEGGGGEEKVKEEDQDEGGARRSSRKDEETGQAQDMPYCSPTLTADIHHLIGTACSQLTPAKDKALNSLPLNLRPSTLEDWIRPPTDLLRTKIIIGAVLLFLKESGLTSSF